MIYKTIIGKTYTHYEDTEMKILCSGCYDKNGTIYYFKEGLLHRVDGPAESFEDGSFSWYLNGKRHREDGPAWEHSSGQTIWYKNGERHREDGPAKETPNGLKMWYLDGEIVYDYEWNNLDDYDDLSEAFKQSIIKYELSR
jgi:hypothetical protein